MTDQAKPDTARLTDAIGPLPDYAPEFRPRWPEDSGGFTGAQMRLYAMQAVASERDQWRKTMRLVADRCDDIADHAESGTCHELRILAVELRAEPINNQHQNTPKIKP